MLSEVDMQMTQLLSDVLSSGASIAIGALGLILVMRCSGVLHFAHGGIITLAAYSALVCLKVCQLPLWVSCLIGIAVAVGSGAFIECYVYRTLRRVLASTLVLFIASLGVYLVVQNGVGLVAGPQLRSIRTWSIAEGWHVFGAVMTPLQVTTVLCAAAALIGTLTLQRWSRVGLYMRAMWNDADLALYVGLPVEKVRLLGVLLGSSLTGVSGILLACDTDLSPTMGLNPLMIALVAIVVGGNVLKGIAPGALLVAIAGNTAVIWLPVRWQSLIVFGLLVGFLILKPRGMCGSNESK